ncbi:MAG TPA: O-antigen ligase family protein [Pyrinomonadaceae bacterium]|nr:O-antigen ligase family protein [Pyrinomonadaceae bacterium]
MSISPLSSTQHSTTTEPPLSRLLEQSTIICLFLFAIFAPHSIAGTQAAWLLGLFFWVLRFALYRRPQFKRTPVDLALLVFFALTLISTVFSYEPGISVGKLRAASLFTIVYLVAQNISSRRIIRLLVLLLIASSFAGSLFTIGERAVGRGVKVQTLRTESPLYTAGVRPGDTLLEINDEKLRDPDHLLQELKTPDPHPVQVKVYRHELVLVYSVPRGKLLHGNSAVAQLGIGSWSSGRDWRASGLFSHYVTYAESLQLVLALAIGLFVALPKKLNLAGTFLLLAIAGMGYALILTVTRAPWAGAVVSTGLIVLFGTRKRVFLLVSLLAIPLVLAGVFMLQARRNIGFIDPKDHSTTWRQTVWREGYQLLLSNPRHLLVGIGMDSIKGRWRQWGMFDGGKIPIGHMHSNLLQLALERGVPALLVWLVLLGLYARVLLLLIRRLKKEAADAAPEGVWIERGLVLGALGGLAGFFVSGIVHYNWGDSEVVMIFYFLMGLTLTLNTLVRNNPNSPAVRHR